MSAISVFKTGPKENRFFGYYNWFNQSGRGDNAIVYKSPTFAGVTGYAMYSFGTDAKND